MGGKGNGKGSKNTNGSATKSEKGTRQDYICRICGNDLIAKTAANGQGRVNPNEHKKLLLTYASESQCKQNHPKATSQLCVG